MSRERALELLDDDPGILPEVDTALTWWTMVAEVGIPADRYLSAMDQLRDERWVYVSATVVALPSGSLTGSLTDAHLTCVHRRLSEDEAAELRRPS